MSKIFFLPSIKDSRGSLTVVEKLLPFEFKRVYFIEAHNGSVRGGHRHKKTIQALICVSGECSVTIQTNSKTNDQVVKLDKSNIMLVLDPEDWHEMRFSADNSILLVIASEFFDENDYISERH